MRVLFNELPRREKYPLPPRMITEKVAETIGIKPQMEKANAMVPATWIAHFAFGAAAGFWYGLQKLDTKQATIRDGIKFGMKVYAWNYAGTLPLAGLYPPPQSQPIERTALMVIAHGVWGATLGLLTKKLRLIL